MKSRYWRMGVGADGMRGIVTYLAVGAGLLRVLSRPSYVGCFGCSFFDQALPGAARQPLTFLAPPRKVSKRRVGALLQQNWFVAPLRGVPGVGRRKSGGKINSLRSDKFSLFIRFAPAATGYSQADLETGSLRIAKGGSVVGRYLVFFSLSFQRKLEPSVVKTVE